MISYDGKYLSREDKLRLFSQWQKFLESGLSESCFTHDIYKDLSNHWGFIAHFNKEGFYIARFAKAKGLATTLEQLSKPSPWTFRDENCSGLGDLHLEMHNAFLSQYRTLVEAAKMQREREITEQIAELQKELQANHPRTAAC